MTGLYESGAACFRNPVDDREPRVDAGAVPCIDAAVDGCGEPEGGRAGEIGIERPDVRVQRIVGCSRQNHEAAALGHAAQGRADMADGRVAHAPLDIGRRGEGRIHQHANRRDARVEIIVDLLGVEAGDRRLRKQRRKHGVASFGELVERERGSRDLGMDGKKSGARRRLEHDLSGAHLRGEAQEKAKAERRRELLELVAFLRTPRVRRQQGGEAFQHGKIAGGTGSLLQHARAIFAQEQNGGRFRGFVGVLPQPGAVLIASLKRGGHRFAQEPRVERTRPPFK